MKYDFSGWVTRNDILCTDGRTIRKDAFKHCDGNTVPLVWNHQHNDPENVLGKVLLQNRDEGVYGFASFNDTRKAQTAKLAVMHGDMDSLSICANHLKQNGGDVLHGDIKEVSLVLAGANSGAHIEEVIRHGEISEDEMVLYMGEEIDLVEGDTDGEPEKKEEEPAPESEPETEAEHADKEEKEEKTEDDRTIGDIFDTLTDEQKEFVYGLIAEALASGGEAEDEEDSAKHAEDIVNESEDKTVKDMFDAFTEEQKNVVYHLIESALEYAKETKHADEDSEEETGDDETNNEIEHTEGGNEMKKNIFEGTGSEEVEVLTHADQVEILNEAKKNGSLKEAVLAHGITDIGNAYPAYKTTPTTPQYVSQDMKWVKEVLDGVHRTPFSHIKSLFADITTENARARGYLTKGSEKVSETIALLKRETDPTTVYKLQKLDRDDILDITDFDIVAWLKEEMRVKLNEELARAYLIGDGRAVDAATKINESKIRPIWKMEDLFAVNSVFEVAAAGTDADIAKGAIKAAVKGFDDYDGSGNTTLFIASDVLSNMLLLEDGFNHRLYKSKEELATAMLVDKIVAVPCMKSQTRTVTISSTDHTRNLVGIIVDLRDYYVGMDKGGQINWFDDFDIDFNKMEYLIETRQSATLVKPNSAIVIEYERAS